MGIRSDEKYQPLIRALTQVQQFCEEQKFENAKELALRLRADSTAQGIRSAQVHWSLAIACDYAGDFEMAFDSIREAVSIDPLAGPVWSSFRIIVERMQRTLADPDRPPSDPVKPRLYGLLLAANEATPACHVAMAGYLRHVGRVGEAVRLLEAVTLLHPAFARAWKELATAARAAGLPDLAARAEAEAVGLPSDEPPWLAPVPRACA